MIYMDPITGDAHLAWARLSPAGGLNALYTRPWTAEHFAKPALTAVSGRVDILRGTHVAGGKGLALTLRGRDGATADVALVIGPAPKTDWALYRDRELVASGGPRGVASRGPVDVVQGDGVIHLKARVDKESDLVLLWA